MSWAVEMVRKFNYAMPMHRLKNKLARWAFRHVEIPPTPQIYGGVQGTLKMRFDLTMEGEQWMYLNNYEPVTLDVIRKVLRPGDTYVDVGANVGLLALVASQRVGPTGKVVAFEPMPSTLERLRENVGLNAAANVRVIGKGCWDSAGEATIHQFTGLHAGQVSMGKPADKTVVREIQITTTRIDDEVSPPVRMLKADVEGAELPALRGAEKLLRESRPHLLIELNPRTTPAMGYAPIDILDWVLQLLPEYRVYVLGRRVPHASNRDDVARRLQERPRKHCDVWLAPRG
jgi:FkbM family methyltransferase